MKNIMSKLKKPYVQIALVMVSILVIAIIPLIIIGFYAHPCADDYTYGYYTHGFWSSTGSLSQTLKWAFHQVKSTYDTWQGTFSSVFLMSLSPAIWGEGYYFLTPIIMLTMIVVPHFYLLKQLMVGFFHSPKSLWLITGSGICFLLIETMFSPVEGLFWYNGAVHYVFMHGCMIMLFGILIKMWNMAKTSRKVILCLPACFLAVMCGGSNYPTALLGILGTTAIVVLMIWKQKFVYGLLPLIIYALSFYFNVTAYGNSIRQTNFEKSSPLAAILDSFAEMFTHVGNWMTLPVILFILLMIPFLWQIVDTDKFSFRFPLLISVVSFCSNACMLTPGLYAMGLSGAGRTINIVKLWFILLLFVNEAYWLGYIKRRFGNRLPNRKIDVRIWTGGVLLMVLIAFVINVEGRLTNYSSYAAYVSLRAGEAVQFHQEYQERVEVLTSDESMVTIEAFTTKPYLLYFDDITTDVYDWRNQAIARWYGKERVYLASP